MDKKILKWIIFIGLFIWQLPQNIVAIVMMPFLGKLKLIEYKHYCFAFEADNMSGSISLGSFIFLCNTHAKQNTVIAHEFGHVWWSQVFGPLYILTIGIPSILWAGFRNKKKYPCYYSFYTERWANNKAGLIAVMSSSGTYCILQFKK